MNEADVGEEFSIFLESLASNEFQQCLNIIMKFQNQINRFNNNDKPLILQELLSEAETRFKKTLIEKIKSKTEEFLKIAQKDGIFKEEDEILQYFSLLVGLALILDGGNNTSKSSNEKHHEYLSTCTNMINRMYTVYVAVFIAIEFEKLKKLVEMKKKIIGTTTASLKVLQNDDGDEEEESPYVKAIDSIYAFYDEKIFVEEKFHVFHLVGNDLYENFVASFQHELDKGIQSIVNYFYDENKCEWFLNQFDDSKTNWSNIPPHQVQTLNDLLHTCSVLLNRTSASSSSSSSTAGTMVNLVELQIKLNEIWMRYYVGKAMENHAWIVIKNKILTSSVVEDVIHICETSVKRAKFTRNRFVLEPICNHIGSFLKDEYLSLLVKVVGKKKKNNTNPSVLGTQNDQDEVAVDYRIINSLEFSMMEITRVLKEHVLPIDFLKMPASLFSDAIEKIKMELESNCQSLLKMMRFGQKFVSLLEPYGNNKEYYLLTLSEFNNNSNNLKVAMTAWFNNNNNNSEKQQDGIFSTLETLQAYLLPGFLIQCFLKNLCSLFFILFEKVMIKNKKVTIFGALKLEMEVKLLVDLLRKPFASQKKLEKDDHDVELKTSVQEEDHNNKNDFLLLNNVLFNESKRLRFIVTLLKLNKKSDSKHLMLAMKNEKIISAQEMEEYLNQRLEPEFYL